MTHCCIDHCLRGNGGNIHGYRYIVVLMAQAKIYWNRENFQMVEKIFRKSVEVCNDDDTWKLNVAHVLFMQAKYKDAIGFYEPIVKKHYDNVSGRRPRSLRPQGAPQSA